MTGKKSAIK